MSNLKYLTILLLLVYTSGECSDSLGQIRNHETFASEYVEARNIAVWLPEGYENNGKEKYSVIYVHDGQNLFDPSSSYAGQDWGLDEVVPSLLRENKIKNVIIVGIWNSPKRMREYQLAAPYDALCKDLKEYVFAELQGKPLGEAYLKFIVGELKPFIDKTYHTEPDRDNTFIMGSSMGGLISLYAITKYPDVFGGAACISTHWPATLNFNNTILGKIIINYLSEKIPAPAHHKIYFDYGTETLDANYEPYQLSIDSVMQSSGYKREVNWITRKFQGHEHSEKFWSKRVHEPLLFLLGNDEH